MWLYVFREDHVLLGMVSNGKRRTHYTGLRCEIDPKIKPAESPREAITRVALQTFGIAVKRPLNAGSYLIHQPGHEDVDALLFWENDFHGQPHQLHALAPVWVSIHALPYELMEPEARLWMPPLTAHRHFRAEFWRKSNGQLERHELVKIP